MNRINPILLFRSSAALLHSLAKPVRFILLALAIVVLAASCKSSANLSKPDAKNNSNGTAAYALKVMANAVKTQTITAKMKIGLGIGEKNISLSGNLRMKRGSVIQLAMTFPIVGEVCRMEFTPEDVLVIDRINARYVKATYDQVDFLRAANLDYYVLESIFWNEIFYPGSRAINEHLNEYTVAAAGAHTLLNLTTAPKLDYAFLTITENALLDRVTISSKNINNSNNLVCIYDNFTKFESGKFPTHLKLNFAGDNQAYSLDISLNSLSNNSDWKERTQVSDKYERIEPEKLFKSLIP